MERFEDLDEQIAAQFARHEAEPNNGSISAAIGALWVKKKEYWSAVAWYEHAFEAGGRVDCALEKIIQDLKSRSLADQD
jgi:hypothetical protein